MFIQMIYSIYEQVFILLFVGACTPCLMLIQAGGMSEIAPKGNSSSLHPNAQSLIRQETKIGFISERYTRYAR